jgi:hypothetical protein
VCLDLALITACGPQVVAVLSDNGANMAAALREVKGVAWLNCLAHSGELLGKDMEKLWPELFTKAASVESLLRNVHFAAACYREEVDKLNQSRAPDQPRFTMLHQPVATRWGSKAECLSSLLANREAVEHTMLRLRREGLQNDDFMAMGWIWQAGVWAEFEGLSRTAGHISAYVHAIEGNSTTLGSGF